MKRALDSLTFAFIRYAVSTLFSNSFTRRHPDISLCSLHTVCAVHAMHADDGGRPEECICV